MNNGGLKVTNSDYGRDRKWADAHTPKIRQITKEYLLKDIIDIRIATDEEDKKYATDYQIIIDGTSIGCRIRKDSSFLFRYKDITFRKSRPYGETEIEKMQRTGLPRWYLYGWDHEGEIFYWILVDMNKFRECGLFAYPDCSDVRNYDKSSTFNGWYINRLDKLKCIKNKSETMAKFLNNYHQPEIKIIPQAIKRKEITLSAFGIT